MSGWDAMPHDTYPLIHEMTRQAYAGREWPEELAALHLRWLQGERIIKNMKASAWPTVRHLAIEWGWKTKDGAPAKDRASSFLSATRGHVLKDGTTITILHWQDGHRHLSLADLRGDRSIGINRDRARREPDGSQTGARRDERTNADNEPPNQTGARREPDGSQTPCASSPHASTGSPFTVHLQDEDTPPPLDGDGDGPEGAGERSSLVALGKAWPSGAQRVWMAYLRWHPRAGTPSSGGRSPLDADRRRIRSAVSQLGPELVEDLVVWAHVSADDRARWLCGRTPKSTGAFLGVDSLLDARKRGERIELVQAWVDAGRPEVDLDLQGAPKRGPLDAARTPTRDDRQRLIDGDFDEDLLEAGSSPEEIEAMKADALARGAARGPPEPLQFAQT